MRRANPIEADGVTYYRPSGTETVPPGYTEHAYRWTWGEHSGTGAVWVLCQADLLVLLNCWNQGSGSWKYTEA